MEGKSQSTVALRAAGLVREYRAESGEAVRALDGLGLSVQSGEFVTLLGPTGCGKTTLLNLVAGLDVPSEGAVEYADGLEPGRNIPCVFQHYTLFPWRTVLSNVAFGPAMKGVPRRERLARAEALLVRVGLGDFKGAYPHELSGGMRQRAAIAQALAVEPQLLLMDEPFGALDDATRRELQRVLIEVWRDTGITVLFVTHNIDEALVMGSRVVVFSERPGRVAADFAIDLPRPRDQHSQAFIELLIKVREALPILA